MEIQEEKNLSTFLREYKIYIIGLVIIILMAVLILMYFKYIKEEPLSPEETVKEKTMEEILEDYTASGGGKKIPIEILRKFSAPK